METDTTGEPLKRLRSRYPLDVQFPRRRDFPRRPQDAASPFDRRFRRPLKVVIDAELDAVAQSATTADWESLSSVEPEPNAVAAHLLGALDAAFDVEVLRFGGTSIPPWAEPAVGSDGIERAPGWVTYTQSGDFATPPEDPRKDFGTHWAHTGVGASESSSVMMYTNGTERFLRSDAVHDSFGRVLGASEVDELTALAIMAAAAEAIDADILVTAHPMWNELPDFLRRGIAVLDPMAATPILGLFLRARGMVGPISAPSHWRATIDLASSWYVVGQALLPNFEHCFAAAIQTDASAEDDRTSWLAMTVLERVCRALRARDQVHGNLLLGPDAHVVSEILDATDLLLFSLIGVFDAVAGLADHFAGLNSERTSISWSNDKWRKAICSANPAIASITQPPGRLGTYRAIAEMRNSVHSGMIGIGAPIDDADRIRVSLPRDSRKLLIKHLNAADPQNAWSVTEDRDGSLTANTGDLVEHIVCNAIPLLDELLAASIPDAMTLSSATDAVRDDRQSFYAIPGGVGCLRLQVGL